MAVNVDWDIIESVEDLDKVFKKAISRAEEADEPAVRQEWSEAKSTFWQRKAEQQLLAGAKRDALDKYPLAKEFADDIKGNSPTEIEAVAKRFHERMEKVTKDADDAKALAVKAEADAKAAATAGYGAPVGAGGGTPSRPAAKGWEELDQRIQDRLAKGDGMQDSQGKMDVARWIPRRVAEAVDASIHNPSYRSFSRQSADDKKVQDDRVKGKRA
jgi:hypothetical protein